MAASVQWPFVFQRLNRQPIDISYVFDSMGAFNAYLATGPAYVGQVVAVRTGTNEPDLYIIDEDFTVRAIGAQAWVDTSNPALTEILTRVMLAHSPILPHELVRLDDLASLTGEPNYSTTPVNTLRRWITGNFVFRRAFITNSGTSLGTPNAIGNIANFAGLVRLDGYLLSPDGYRVPINYNSGAGSAYFSVMIHDTGDVVELHGNAAFSDRRIILIIDFLQPQVDVTVWDHGTTSWTETSGLVTLWDVI